MAMEIIDDAIARYPVDRNRIYVMGISMGGYAAWELMQRRPELFAAGLPCCGGGDVAQALRLKDIAIWCSNGSSPSADSFLDAERPLDSTPRQRKVSVVDVRR